MDEVIRALPAYRLAINFNLVPAVRRSIRRNGQTDNLTGFRLNADEIHTLALNMAHLLNLRVAAFRVFDSRIILAMPLDN